MFSTLLQTNILNVFVYLVLHPGQILPRSGCNATPDPQIYADPNIYQLKSANKDPSKPRSELKERLSKMYFSLNG